MVEILRAAAVANPAETPAAAKGAAPVTEQTQVRKHRKAALRATRLTKPQKMQRGTIIARIHGY